MGNMVDFGLTKRSRFTPAPVGGILTSFGYNVEDAGPPPVLLNASFPDKAAITVS